MSSTKPTSNTSIRWSELPISRISLCQIEQPRLPAALEQELVALPDAHQIGRCWHARHGRFADEDVALVAANHYRGALDGHDAQRSIGEARQRAGIHCIFALRD